MTELLEQEQSNGGELAVMINDENLARLNVEIKELELEPYQKQYIKEKRKNVLLRGFRKGHAPEEMVAKFFKEEARTAARDNLIYMRYAKLLQDHKLKPLSQPKIDELKDENGKIDARLSVEVLQPVLLGQYLGLEIEEMPVRDVNDALGRTIASIKSSYPKLVDEVGAVSGNGYIATIDFVMSEVGGDSKDLETQKDFKVRFGAGMYFGDFESNLSGMKVGDSKKFDITFPETYHKEELKNKSVHFDVSVKGIQKVEEYNNDELAKILGYDTEEKLVSGIKSDIEKKYKEEETQFYETQILSQLLEAHKFKIPKSLIDSEVANIMAERKDMSQEQVLETADRFVRTDLILQAIYERHPDLQLSQEGFNAKVGELAAKAGESIEVTVEKLKTAGKLQTYINYLVNCRVVEFLVEMAEKKRRDNTIYDKTDWHDLYISVGEYLEKCEIELANLKLTATPEYFKYWRNQLYLRKEWFYVKNSYRPEEPIPIDNNDYIRWKENIEK